jgi:hypothetical protein
MDPTQRRSSPFSRPNLGVASLAVTRIWRQDQSVLQVRSCCRRPLNRRAANARSRSAHRRSLGVVRGCKFKGFSRRLSFGHSHECVDENGFVLPEDQCRGARIERRLRPERPDPLRHHWLFRRGENVVVQRRRHAGRLLSPQFHFYRLNLAERFLPDV